MEVMRPSLTLIALAAGCGLADAPLVSLKPLAPTADEHLYQGMQTRFVDGHGVECSARVAASMGPSAFCYLGADDDVKCAGTVGGVDYGQTFRSVGVRNAVQIMVSFLGDGICVTRTDHTVECMGTNTNAFGQNGLSSRFEPWIARNDIVAIGSGTWDQICGITTAGQVLCGGLGNPDFGTPPVAVGPPGQTSFWVDPAGTVHPSDPQVLRPAESRTECTIEAAGLVCLANSYPQPAAKVVMGSQIGAGGIETPACWLDESGTVGCNGNRHVFTAGQVLFLAEDYYSDSLCAIYNDGSIWCVGSNDGGKLGTGDSVALPVETMVAPPGSAHVACERWLG